MITKELTITISGETNSGKSIMQCLIINILKDGGMKNVEFIPDNDFNTKEELDVYVLKIIDEIENDDGFLNQFKVKVETKQLNKPIKGSNT